jgi:hypothetical protein
LYRSVVGLLCAIVLLLAVQNIILWNGIGWLRKSIESADASAIDAVEIGKEIRAAQSKESQTPTELRVIPIESSSRWL